MSKRVQFQNNNPNKQANNMNNNSNAITKKLEPNQPNQVNKINNQSPPKQLNKSNNSTPQRQLNKSNDSISMKRNDNNSFQNNSTKKNQPLIPTQEYLNLNIVSALTEGMFQVSQAKPSNPIEFLGRYLLEQSMKNKQRK